MEAAAQSPALFAADRLDQATTHETLAKEFEVAVERGDFFRHGGTLTLAGDIPT
jgi:hypothetical protein